MGVSVTLGEVVLVEVSPATLVCVSVGDEPGFGVSLAVEVGPPGVNVAGVTVPVIVGVGVST